MHFYCIARGQYTHLNQWIADLSGKYFPFEYEPGQMGMAQLGVRPVQLFELAFPEDKLQDVLRILNANYPKRRMAAYALKKAMNLKDVPKMEGAPLTVANGGILAPFVAVEPIGIKKDMWQCRKCKKMFREKTQCCGGNAIEFI